MVTFIFISIVLVAYVVVFHYPGVACGLVLSSYALEQYAQATVPLAGSFSPLCNYLTAGAVVIGVGGHILRKGPRVFRVRAPGLLVLLLLSYCYATVLWSLFPSTSEALLREQIPYLAVFVGLTPIVIQDLRDLEHAMLTLVVAGTLPLIGLLVFGTWAQRGVRLLSGHESNPLALAQAAGAVLITASLTKIVPKYFGRMWPLVACVLFVTVVLTFLRTASRGQIVAAVGVTALFSSVRKGYRWVPLFGVAGLAILAASFGFQELEHNANRWDTERFGDDLTQGRTTRAALLLDIWSQSASQRIWLGLGNGTAQDPRVLGHYPHMVPAEVLAEEGLLGLLIYIVAIVVSLTFYAQARRSMSADRDGLIYATLSLTVYELILTFKQGTLLSAASLLLLLVLPGALREIPKARPAPQLVRAGE